MKQWVRVLVGLATVGLVAELRSAEVTQKSASTGRIAEIHVDTTPLNRSSRSPVTSYADALEQIRRCVVSVHSSRIVRQRGPGFPFDDPIFRYFFGPAPDQGVERRVPSGLGSGVIVTADGYILTNNHVVEGSDEISVALPDGRELEATVVGVDPKTDVAVVKIPVEGLEFAVLADSDQLRVGDVVFAIGNPLGVGQTTTMGIVSATGRSNLRLIEEGYESFIQTDASINPGNSGGALVDAEGRLVGINTAILSPTQGNIGIGFAIPINLAAAVLRSLIETGSVSRGYLGIESQELDQNLAEFFGVPDGRGVLVREVTPGSPAETAGLRHGDVIVAFNGRPVANSNELRLAIAQSVPGSTVKIRFSRDREIQEVDVVLARLDAAGGENEILQGVRVSPLTTELRQRYRIPAGLTGLVVTEVEAGSRFAAVFPPGTLIEQINRVRVTEFSQARRALGRGQNLFLVTYRGVRRYLAIELN